MRIGDFLKIRIPIHSVRGFAAETPWAEVIKVMKDGKILGRIDNHLVASDIHGYSYNEKCVFRNIPSGTPGVSTWEPIFKVHD